MADPTVTSATLTDTALDGLARAVGNPAGPGSWRLGLVRVFALMASIGDTRGLSRLCKAVPGLAPLPLRAAVITALAEGAPACASAVLSACAAAANDPLAARCTTLFDRVGR